MRPTYFLFLEMLLKFRAFHGSMLILASLASFFFFFFFFKEIALKYMYITRGCRGHFDIGTPSILMKSQYFASVKSSRYFICLWRGYSESFPAIWKIHYNINLNHPAIEEKGRIEFSFLSVTW